MVTTEKRPKTKRRTAKRRIFDEIADFLAGSPSHQRILDFHPAAGIQRRASKLLAKSRDGTLTDDEREELDEFAHAETLFRRLKSKIREAMPS